MARRIPDGAINDNANGFGAPDDDIIQPFQLEQSGLRGRAVRLGKVLDDILGPHDYPEPVAHLVAETITLTTLLSSMLKYEGIFTLQTKGDGPVGMVVADMTSKGEIRGCASFDKERVAKYGDDIDMLPFYLGKGYIAFTVDQLGKTDRYQGIVELKGTSLVDCVRHYFDQSEQIKTGIKMSVGLKDGKWRAGAIMLQHMPEDQKKPEMIDRDDWNRSMMLLDTAKDGEFLDPGLHSRELLLRLFHEEGVRVFKPLDISKGCRCDSDKVQKVLAGLPEEDIKYLMENGTINMHCEFCSRDFKLDPEVIKGRHGKKPPKKKK
ncbi:MAG: Hsp33 family molecular chaperone HslO [Alphaproteobacteria bacterium]